MTNINSICPHCGSDSVAKVLYGMPGIDDDLVRELIDGSAVLGGCVVTNDAKFWCDDCKSGFSNDGFSFRTH